MVVPRRPLRRKTKLLLVAVLVLVAVNFSLFLSTSSTASPEDDSLLDAHVTARVLQVPTQLPVFERDRRRNDSLLFTSLTAAHAHMRSVTSFENHKSVIIHYPPYERHSPRFINETDREFFMMSAVNRQNLLPPPPEQLRGVVDVIEN